MSVSSALTSVSFGVINQGSTVYGIGPAGADGTVDSIEANTQWTLRTAGQFSYLTFSISQNNVTNPSTLTLRKGGVDTILTLSFAGGATGTFTDPTDSVSFAAGNVAGYKFVSGSGTGGTTLTPRIASVRFFPTAEDTCVTRFGVESQSANTTNNSATVFWALSGVGTSFTSTEANAQQKFKIAGTLRNFFYRTDTNARTVTDTFGTRINGVNGNIAVSVTTGATGTFEDTTHTDTISVNDLVCLYWTGGASAAATRQRVIGLEFVNTAGYFFCHAGAGAGTTQSPSTTSYYYITGAIVANATEATRTAVMPIPFVASGFNCFVSANSLTQNCSLALRKNQASSGISIAITALTTGYFEDATHSVNVAPLDTLDVQLTTLSGGTSIALSSINFIGYSAPEFPDRRDQFFDMELPLSVEAY